MMAHFREKVSYCSVNETKNRKEVLRDDRADFDHVLHGSR